MDILNFMGGGFVPAQSKNTFLKHSPFSGQVISVVSASDAMDVVVALQSAKKAAPLWATSSRKERSEVLHRLADYLQENSMTIAHDEALHQGLSQAFVAEESVSVAIDILRKNARSLLLELPEKTWVQPTGIVGIITSWCFSLRLIIERLAPALAAGNVCLVKVSEHSPITGKILGEAFQQIQLPAGVVSLIQGAAEVGQVIAGHPSVRAVTAVGRTTTIESVAGAALTQFKKVQLSGSAKNPAIILADTDFQAILPEVLRPFLMGQGQLCWNTSRIFVVESLAPAFLEAVKEFFLGLQPLLHPQGAEVWTPMITNSAVSAIDLKVRNGVGEHGKVFVGGKRKEGSGFFYEPTVMIDLPNCSTMQQDELAGPLLLITPVKYQHDALKWANTSYLGHSGIIWGPEEKAFKVAVQLECAQVSVNSWSTGEGLPIFGFKQSSFGNLDMSWSGNFYSDVKKLAGRF